MFDLTPRQEVRLALATHRSMDDVEFDWRRGRLSCDAYVRFMRLWAWTTATHHPKTISVAFQRWADRRAIMRTVIKAFVAKYQNNPSAVMES